MRALVCESYGQPADLVLKDVKDPAAGKGEVVVDVHAAGINFPDLLVFAGKYQVRRQPPFIPGYEACGVISCIGEGVTRYSVGDKVIATPPAGGCFAEKLAVDERHISLLPAPLSFEQGAGFPITYGTSYHALKQGAGLQPGESLLVLGAAGGVGTTAIEIAVAMGARVIAAASTDSKLHFATSVGAHETVNYSSASLKDALRELTGGDGVDIVYDPVGGELAEQALRATAWHGRYLVVGFASGSIPQLPANLILLKEAKVIGVFWGAWAERNPAAQLANAGELTDLLSAGKLRPAITASYALDEYVTAYAELANRRTTGKTVFRIR